MEIVALGRTGLNVSRLSIGTGSNGWNGRSNQTDLGYEALRDLLLFAYEKGVTFWDSADQYGESSTRQGSTRRTATGKCHYHYKDGIPHTRNDRSGRKAIS